jgi:GT2 family glycosyltransferase
VVVTYASSAVIADCLAAVRDALRNVGPSRVIVVDNASPDDTCRIVAATAPDVELIRRPTNDGFAAGVNAGIAAAPGSDVLVLNADVRLAPEAVAELRRTSALPGVGIAVPRLLTAAGDMHRSLRRRPTVLRALGEAVLGGTRAGHVPVLGETILSAAHYEQPATVDWATGAAWLVSNECLAAVGRLDDRYFLYSEETEFMLRAADHGFAVRYEPRAIAVHLGGEQQVSPRLSALAVANRVRLHRERRGRGAAAAMWAAAALNEMTRVLARRERRAVHVAALRELLQMRRWPTTPAGEAAVTRARKGSPS